MRGLKQENLWLWKWGCSCYEILLFLFRSFLDLFVQSNQIPRDTPNTWAHMCCASSGGALHSMLLRPPAAGSLS